jgi:hypothetical protein
VTRAEVGEEPAVSAVVAGATRAEVGEEPAVSAVVAGARAPFYRPAEGRRRATDVTRALNWQLRSVSLALSADVTRSSRPLTR